MVLRVGIIGTGWGCKVQVPAFRAAGLEVTAVFSRDRAKAQKLCDKLKVAHAFDSIDALCGCPDVDVVSVVSPTFLHAEHALAVLRSGKHLLTDKPMAVTAAEAAAMVAEAAGRPQQIAIVDHELRFLGCVRKARDWVASGAIGQVRHVTAQWLLNMGGFGRSHSWWHERSKGGGVSGAVGVHVIDLCAFVSGRRITRLVGQAQTFTKEKPVKKGSEETKAVTSDEFIALAGQLEDGGAINIAVSGVSWAPPARSVTVVGEKGTVVVDLEAMSAAHLDTSGGEVASFAEENAGGEAFMHATFLLARALAASGGRPGSEELAVACRMADGAYTQKVVEALLTSSDSGRAATVAGGAEASRL